MKTKNIKVSIEIEKPRRCGECPFFHIRNIDVIMSGDMNHAAV